MQVSTPWIADRPESISVPVSTSSGKVVPRSKWPSPIRNASRSAEVAGALVPNRRHLHRLGDVHAVSGLKIVAKFHEAAVGVNVGPIVRLGVKQFGHLQHGRIAGAIVDPEGGVDLIPGSGLAPIFQRPARQLASM